MQRSPSPSSISRDAPPELILHEQNHGDYFVTPEFREASKRVTESLDVETRRIVADLIGELLDYDKTDEDLMIRSCAYLADPEDFKSNFLSTIEGELLAGIPQRGVAIFDKDANMLQLPRAALKSAIEKVKAILPPYLKPDTGFGNSPNKTSTDMPKIRLNSEHQREHLMQIQA